VATIPDGCWQCRLAAPAAYKNTLERDWIAQRFAVAAAESQVRAPRSPNGNEGELIPEPTDESIREAPPADRKR
jgi:hypothetical protein